jgi:UDP-N-acetylglucosamine--N-acetylmuramyl-(pentapeptide) pyrophosphoryl-undecaprenol N-acetylglucosamine transferase
MKTIVLTGGGSAGHVTPNIALIPGLKKAGYIINYIGSRTGIEKQLIEKEGIPYFEINTGKLRRYFDLKNFTDVFRVMDGFREAFSLIKKLTPDLVFSKGGFVSCPVVWAAWLAKIPVVIHESDMTPGLTNKLSIPFARKVCYTFPESKIHIPLKKGVHTGIPIRENLLNGDKDLGRKYCGFNNQKPIMMVIGGSLGSEKINKIIKDNLNTLLQDFQICHICGKGNINKELNSVKGYMQFEYINEEQPHIYAIADIIISRAGATVLYEILALKKPNLLIPLSKKASRGDQILNAQSFKSQGFSQVLTEEDMTDETFLNEIKESVKNKEKFINSMKISEQGNAITLILKVLDDYVVRRDGSPAPL